MLSDKSEEPDIFIYKNPNYVKEIIQKNRTVEILGEEKEPVKLNLLKKKTKDKKGFLENLNEKKTEIRNPDDELKLSIHKFETSVFNFIYEINDNNEENKKIFNEKIQSSSNPNLKRMYYLYILGGESSASHFFNSNGSYKTSYQIEKEILHILKSQTIELTNYLSDNIAYNKENNYKRYILLNGIRAFKHLIYYISNFIKTKINYKGILFLYALIYYYLEKYSLFVSISGLSLLLIIKLIFNFIDLETFKNNFMHYKDNNELSQEFKSKIKLFTDEFILLDKKIDDLKTKQDEVLIKDIHKYISSTDSFFSSKKSKLGSFLIKNLEKAENPNEFYLESLKSNLFIPLSIYFFNSIGEERTVREIICSIIIISRDFDSRDYSNLKVADSNVIKYSDKKNLLKTFKGGNNLYKKKSQKKIIKNKSKKQVNKNN